MGFAISDEFLGTFVPILVYWVYSGMYICLGSLERYRLHSKVDEDEKNLVTKSAVVRAFFFSRLFRPSSPLFSSRVMTHDIVMILCIGRNCFEITGSDDPDASTTQQFSLLLLARQLIVAMLVIDTWQYFIHRYMHINKFLYKHIHSQHHRLIVPYSYGALYNHPLEGLLLDTIGGALSFLFSGMSPRTAIFFSPSLPSRRLMITVDYGPREPVSHLLQILGTYLPYSLEKRATGGFETRPIKASKEE
ncbi:hypothetical protein Bca52824_096455 [Brassica carinata]|uniref:Fatty acid hydroxylase domain-containing protein n=1 Tax=Brassica carinata TaxID=52824 RepID=A0A8X7P0D0_BRACI|nr:hypothetical protein Bca52824_096455 [Brassica carinata]